MAQTVGLTHYDERSFDGYTLFSPFPSDSTFLLNEEGRVVHAWGGEAQAMQAYLLEDGSIMRAWDQAGSGEHLVFSAGGDAGFLDRIDWDGNLLWRFEYHTDDYRAHHDIEVLPNGNVLMIAWEHKSTEQFVAAGGNPSLLEGGELWPDHIIEVRQSGPTTGEVVWEWHVWDHLIQAYDEGKPNFGVIADHPELINLNLHPGDPDWNHLNGVDYNPALDQIALSSPTFDELWIIDHSTTTEEAAGHSGGNSGRGGDLIYRWGSPVDYGRGTQEDEMLFFQHDVQWIKPGLEGEGNLLLFNNRHLNEEGEMFSTVDELTPPLLPDGSYELVGDNPYGPTDFVWTYEAPVPTDFVGRAISGAQRLANGNTLICNGARGRIFEVTPEGETVWAFRNPFTGTAVLAQGDSVAEFSNLYFKCNRYPAEFPAFEGRDLTPGRVLHLRGEKQVALSVPVHAEEDVVLDPNFEWEAVAGAGSYRFQMSESLSFTEPIMEADVDATSYQSDSLASGRTYYWRVRADNADPDMWSDSQRFTTILIAPAQVTLAAPLNGATEVAAYTEFEWAPAENATGYHLQVANDTLFSAPVIDDSTLTETSLEAPLPLEYNTIFYWRVRARNGSGIAGLAGPWSKAWSFTVAVGTAVESDVTIPQTLAVLGNYPNPFSTETNIRFEVPDDGIVRLTVYDALGKIVYDTPRERVGPGQHAWRFDGSTVPSGVYLYRIESSGRVAAGRMIVAH